MPVLAVYAERCAPLGVSSQGPSQARLIGPVMGLGSDRELPPLAFVRRVRVRDGRNLRAAWRVHPTLRLQLMVEQPAMGPE